MTFVLSVQHTGTWFIINFLEHLLNKNAVLLNSLFDDISKFNLQALQDVDILQVHPMLYLDADPIYIDPSITTLISEYRTIIPIRDPILCLISRQNRHPRWTHHYLIHSFNYLSTLDHNNIFFFPVDLYTDANDRLKLLQDALTHTGYNITEDALLKTAGTWEVCNSARDRYNYKEKYRSGNLKALERTIGDEISMLKRFPNIQQFLQGLGYEHLEWYS